MNKVLINNKKAFFDYEIVDKVEAGIVLEGWEVKSVKAQKMSFEGSFIRELNGEMFLMNSRIVPTKYSPDIPKDKIEKPKKLLLSKQQILKLALESDKSGMTIIPLDVHIASNGLIKVEIGLAKGKKKFDKRAKLREKDVQRKIQEDRKKYNF